MPCRRFRASFCLLLCTSYPELPAGSIDVLSPGLPVRGIGAQAVQLVYELYDGETIRATVIGEGCRVEGDDVYMGV